MLHDSFKESQSSSERSTGVMAEQTVTVGNAIIVLAGTDDPFSDGHTTGYLEFYDERHRPAFPLTSYTVGNHLLVIVNEPSMPALWKAGRIAGSKEERQNEHQSVQIPYISTQGDNGKTPMGAGPMPRTLQRRLARAPRRLRDGGQAASQLLR